MILQVGVKVLMQNNEGSYLFLKRAQTLQDEAEPYWDIPGGRINSEEILHDALRREVLEETGITAVGDFQLIAAQDIMVPAKDLHVVRLTYTAHESGEVQTSDEHQEVAWATKEDALAFHLDPYLQEVLGKL